MFQQFQRYNFFSSRILYSPKIAGLAGRGGNNMRSHEDLNRSSSQIFIICYSKLYFRIVGFSVSVTPMSSNEPCLKGFLLVKISSLFPSQYQLLPVVCPTRFPLLKVFCLRWASSQQSRVRKIAPHSFSSVWSGDYSL